MKGVSSLSVGDPVVFMADLDAQPGHERLLSPEEVRRAERFRSSRDRRRYVAARGVLRVLLGDLLTQDPARIRIATATHGKPVLGEGGPIEFSVAHSRGSALYAFTTAGDVGIDVEHVRTLDPLTLARTCFSSAEQDELKAVEPEGRLGTFFDGWVRKEAVVKADGRGLTLALQSFTVTLRGTPRITKPPPGGPASQWSLMEVDAGQAVRAALAIRTRSGHQDGRS